MRLSTDKPGMNLVQRRAEIGENGVVSLPQTYSLVGGKILRLVLGPDINGHFVPAMEMLEWEVDAMRGGLVENGVLYLRNYGTSAIVLEAQDPLGTFVKKAGRPKKKAAAEKEAA